MSMKDIIGPFLGIKSKLDRGDYSKGLGDIDIDLGFATLTSLASYFTEEPSYNSKIVELYEKASYNNVKKRLEKKGLL